MSILPILLLFILMWFLVIRPQRRRQQEQQRVMDNLSPGDEIITAGGLYGTVQSVSATTRSASRSRRTCTCRAAARLRRC